MAGSRYTINVDVAGNAEGAFYNIGRALGRVVYMAQNMTGGLGGATEQLGQVASAARAGALMQLGDQAKGFSMRLEEMNAQLIETTKGVAQAIIKDTATFQDAQSSMQFAFGADWKNMYDKVLGESAKLTFTFEETLGLASSLGRLKINPFGTTGENLNIFKSKTGQMVSALEVIQDASDAAGRGTERMMFSLREAVSGDWKSLRDALDMPKQMTEDWKKQMDALPDQQAKYNRLIELIGGMFGGAGALRAKNFNKIMAQIPDILQQIKAAIGAEGIKPITEAFSEFVGMLGGLAKDKQLLNSLAGSFAVLASGVAFLIRGGTKLVKMLAELVKAVPVLPVFVVGVIAATVAVLGFGTVAFGAAGGIAVLVAGVMLLSAKALLLGAAIAIAAAPLTLLFGGVVLAGAAALVGLLATAVQLMGSEKVTSFADGLNKIKIVFIALKELISSYNDGAGTMSLETAAALEKSGMKGFVDKVFNVFGKLDILWTSFTETLGTMGDALAPEFLPMLTEIKNLFFELADAFGLTKSFTDASGSSSKSWVDTGKQLATVIIDLTRGLIRFIRLSVGLVRMANDMGLVKGAAYVLVGTFLLMGGVIAGLVAGAALLGTVLFTAFAAVTAPIWGTIAAIAALVIGIDEAVRGIQKLTGMKVTGILGEGNSAMPGIKGFFDKVGAIKDAVLSPGKHFEGLMGPKPAPPSAAGLSPLSDKAFAELSNVEMAPGLHPFEAARGRLAQEDASGIAGGQGAFGGGAPFTQAAIDAGAAVPKAPSFEDFMASMGVAPATAAPAKTGGEEQTKLLADQLAVAKLAAEENANGLQKLASSLASQPIQLTLDKKVLARAVRDMSIAVDGASR